MVDSEIKVDVDFKKLKKTVEELSKQYTVRVGILASKGGADEVSENLDLAGLGAVQEFGCDINVTDKMRAFLRGKGICLKADTTQIHIPARSFLTMPLMRDGEIRKKIKKIVYPNDTVDTLNQLIEQGDKELLEVVAMAIALSAVQQIDEAFETRGFGEWQPDSPMTIANKGSDMPLIDTGRLRSSITFEINKGG